MTSKREIVWIPSIIPNKLIHLSYNSKGSYAIRDFVNPVKRGENVYAEILPLIKWKKDATGFDFVSVDNADFWKNRLEELSQQVIQGKIIEKNKNYTSSTASKPLKHTNILGFVENIFNHYQPDYRVFLGTHGKGSHGVHYREAEKRSNRAYYSLKMYKSLPPKKGYNVKDPDCIVIKKNIIKYVIEIKWGYLKNYPNESTDMLSIFKNKELKETLETINYSKCCRVKGPYVSDGDEIPAKFTKDYIVNENTKYLIISDLKGLLENRKSDFNSIKNKYQNYQNLFDICDIKEDVDIFNSLTNYLKK